MKKRYLVLAGCLALCFACASVATAAEGSYAGILAGVNIPTDSDWTGPDHDTINIEYDPGYTAGVFLGYDFGMFRAEGEIRYHEADVDKLGLYGVSLDASADVSVWSYMVNGYWDFENNSSLTPFLGVGIGVANVEIKDFSILGYSIPGEDDDTQLAYQFMAGVDYAVSPQTMLGLSYRYFATSDLEFEGNEEIEYGAHNVIASIRFNF